MGIGKHLLWSMSFNGFGSISEAHSTLPSLMCRLFLFLLIQFPCGSCWLQLRSYLHGCKTAQHTKKWIVTSTLHVLINNLENNTIKNIGHIIHKIHVHKSIRNYAYYANLSAVRPADDMLHFISIHGIN